MLTTIARRAALSAIAQFADQGGDKATIIFRDKDNNILATAPCANPAFSIDTDGTLRLNAIAPARVTKAGRADNWALISASGSSIYLGSAGKKNSTAEGKMSSIDLEVDEKIEINNFIIRMKD